MEHDWEVKDALKLQEMSKNLKLIQFFVKGSMALAEVTVALNAVVRIILINFDKKNSTEKLLFLSSKFFYDTNQSPTYEITWFGQLLAGILAGVVFINYDSFFVITVFHLCSQLSILKMDIRDLVNQSKKQTFLKALHPIVRRHLQLKE